MYIAMNERPVGSLGIMGVLPQQIRKYMCNIDLDEAQELRLISGKPLMIRYPDGAYYLSNKSVLSGSAHNAVRVTERQLDEVWERITRSSIYSVRDEIRNGYITIEGGHRVGIAGTAVTENGNVEFIKNVSAVNIRLAREVIGAAGMIIDHIRGSMLIVSPPCGGKTTMLRDIARSLSYKGYSVAIADERCEIAAMYNGRSAFDLGNTTTVLDNCPKHEAMLMLLRSMSPDVIITDEIGTVKDAEAIRSIVNSGVGVIASIHGRDIGQLMKRRHISELARMFDTIVILSRRNGVGTIEEIINNA